MGKSKLTGKELGKGICQESDGTYKIQIFVSGKHFTKRAKTITEARDIRRNLTTAKAKDKLTVKPNITVSAYFCKWLETEKHGNSEVSKNRDCSLFTNNISGIIGHRKVADIRPLDIQAVFNTLDDKGLSKSTIKDCRRLLRDLFESAVENQIAEKNPVTRRLKIGGTEKKENFILSPKKQALFEELCANSDDIFAMDFVFVLSTGLRYGELVGLKWSDINFANKTLTVNRSLYKSENKKKWVEKAPKTKAGYRTIPLAPKAIQCLNFRRDLGIEPSPECSDFIFLNSKGKHTERSNYHRALHQIFDRMLKEENITEEEHALKFSLHTLRHTFATRCVENGINSKYLQSIMGHDDISTTMNYYVHSTDEMGKAAFLQVFGD